MDKSLKYSKLSTQEVVEDLKSDPQNGLSNKKQQELISKYGLNKLNVNQPIKKLEILKRQIKSIIVTLLIIAMLLSIMLGEYIESIAILAVLIVNTALGFFTELKAVRAVESLKSYDLSYCIVIRDGAKAKIKIEELVPGDIVILEAGDIIGADLRVIEANNINVNESILTGESAPVTKNTGKLLKNTSIAERINILFKGTALNTGSGKGIVISTGMDTELGKIAHFLQDQKEEITPLEKRLERLGAQLVWLSIFIAILIAALGYQTGKDIFLMVETAIALAVATIPEGLPIVATLALAKGMWKMAENNALLQKLAAVETLGATSIILTDKTGTLTENKMTVQTIITMDDDYDLSQREYDIQNKEQLEQALKIGVLCNNSSENVGDPMESALIVAAKKLKIEIDKLKAKYPKIKEDPFNSDTLLMATYHQGENEIFIAIKGAPEAMIRASNLSQENKKKWLNRNKNLANEGQRVLAIGKKHSKTQDVKSDHNINFIGLIGFIDPARKDIKQAIKKSQSAGIKIIMVTGDQKGTAIKIAKDIGLLKDNDFNCINGEEIKSFEHNQKIMGDKINSTLIFSRVSPEQKFKLVQFFQSQNLVVAMTGDGVNDAPALKKADIGIAMGIRGTQMAKEASDMVLQDDSFSTIILAIKQGRVIYSNIQRFVIYLLSCNISEILVITIASILNTPLPLLPLQILFLNLVTDVFPALALGMGEGDESYLTIKPRNRSDEIIDIRKWAIIILYGIIITISIFIGFYYTYKVTKSIQVAHTVSFLSLAFAQVIHVFNMRTQGSSHLFNDVTKNIHVWAAVILCTLILISTMSFDSIMQILTLHSLSPNEWLIVTLCSIAPLIIIQILSRFQLGIRAN